MKTEYNKKKQAVLYTQFDELQQKLIPLWEQIGRSDPGSHILEEENTLVVLPSLTVDIKLDFSSQQAYEERMLFMLFLLRQPHIRLIYLTSVPIPTEIIDYYLDVLPSVSISNARRRLFLISPQDTSDRPLVHKVLERPRLIEQIRNRIPDLNMAHLVPFLTTDLERDFAVQLGIPMYAADPRYFAFGTKSGCRRIFAEEGVQHPLGTEDLSSKDDLVQALCQMRAQKPSIEKVIVKHNEGVSGYGNATLDLVGLPNPGTSNEKSDLENRLKEMQFELADAEYDWYMEQLEIKGGIVEELISGEEIFSPSAQLRVTPLGDVELLSTHDQILGGPSGQVYMGARFPANLEYGPMIMHEAEKVGKRFAREGIVGRFALDFIVVRDVHGNWNPYAIEVNLRKGGTTHPFLTLLFLTGGKFYANSGVFKTAQGLAKYYVATDTLKSPTYKRLTSADLFDIVSNHRLHFDHTSHTGVVLHMISGVSTLGKLGLTAIGDTPEHAEEIYQRFISVLNQAAT
ncbi:MAG: ATP-grasp domain-containing protein [Chloroflexi bacterium]|nr:ATP-grasp domain-containing protein [Chloroflexota bacterium]